MKKYVITIVIIVAIIILFLGTMYIYSSNNQNNEEDLSTKADKEIIYLSSTIINLLNDFNNITYVNYKIVEEEVPMKDENSQSSSSSSEQQKSSSGGGGEEQSNNESSTTTNINLKDSSILVNDDKKVNWDKIKKETENMYNTWTTILIDLNSLNVNRDNLLKYTSTLNEITETLEKKDKATAMIKFADLYNLVIGYLRDYSNNNKLIHVCETKANILYAYALAEQDNRWNDMKNYIKQAQGSYINIINNQTQNGNNSINKAYILLNEIESSIDKNNKSIFYINYKNLMQELDIVQK